VAAPGLAGVRQADEAELGAASAVETEQAGQPALANHKENEMKTLIGNQVQTDYSNYAFKSREEAEAFYFAARERAMPKTPDVRAKQQPDMKRKK
jgi:hypothetical protein